MPESKPIRIAATVDSPSESIGWRLEDIDFTAIDSTHSAADEPLLLLLIASSFIESGTHLYASNLMTHFDGDQEITTWLTEQWEAEELQHGRALRTYVSHAWPSFDWEQAYAGFIAAFAPLCTMSRLEPRRGLEMVGRCVVETSTTSLYRAIQGHARDPVLRDVVRRIGDDEVRHYKHFLRYFREYQLRERCGRIAVFGALVRRSLEIGLRDTDSGLRHAYNGRYRNTTTPHPTFEETRRAVHALLRPNVLVGLAGAMWLRPLQLPHRIEGALRSLFSGVARVLLFLSAPGRTDASASQPKPQ
ncbi:MAG: ferritin-like domain-containing protein [Burkholderiales bacterium]